MKKIVIFGSQGMLGHVATRFFRETGEYSVIECARHVDGKGHSLDVTDFDSVRDVLALEKPDYVLNCIGMLIRACNSRPDLAILVNAYFPQYLARLSKEIGFKLIHVSTDCVFSGKTGGYREDSFKDGDTQYDRTKALGEVVDDRNLTIRTSIIGPELKADGTGLFHWFMNQHGTVRGYTGAIWSGVTTYELAKAIDAAIKQDIVGLYQLTMPPINKYELLCLLKKIWDKRDVVVEPFADFHCDKSMVCTRTDFNYQLPPSHEVMLQQLHDWYK